MTEYKNYARLISQELHLDYNDVLKMTVEDINKFSMDAFEKLISERMKDEELRKILAWLTPEYEFLYEHLGDCLIRAFCMRENGSYFSHNSYHGEYKDDPEKEAILVSNLGHYDASVKTIDSYYFSKIFMDALFLKYPEISMYSPSIYSYSNFKRDEVIDFHVKTGVGEEGQDEIFHFRCTINGFLSLDKDAIIEDFLDLIALYDISEKKDATFINVNNFFNSSAAKEFFDLIESLKNN